MNFLSPAPSYAAIVAFLIPGNVFWPYFLGLVVLIAGLAAILRGDLQRAEGLDKAIVFGPVFLAMPMAVFAGDHFVAARIIAGMVPAWIPGHLFWAYFVGTALIAAALSISLKKYSALAATLLSIMLFSFVVLIHIPNWRADPSNRIVMVVFFRDLSFSAGAMALGLTLAGSASRRKNLMVLVRYWIAIGAVIFGAEHFLHPECVPVVPLAMVMPSWFPGHAVVSYLSGVVLIACGGCLMANWNARRAAAVLGIVVFAIVMLVYLPITVERASDIANGLNYFADTLAYGGAVLGLAGALPKAEIAQQADATQRDARFTGAA